MESIFTCTETGGLWLPCIPGSQSNFPQSSITGVLKIKTPKELQTISVQLCGNYLVQLNTMGFPERYINLELKIFEPFVEDSNCEKLYGFYIENQVFYTDTDQMLNVWVKALKKICILTHIEDDYILIKSIGKGSTSIVYLAESVASSKQVSVKCVKKSSITSIANLMNLGNEIKILQRLKHDNICKLYYVYEDREAVYFVMEYLPHGDLLSRLNQKEKFSEVDSAKFMGKLLTTLDYLHSQNIVHRDLKLENILMTGPNDDDFKIIDFGLSYINTSPQHKKCGSPGYVAPEILRDEEYDNKIDIFSSGVILYVLLYGKHPFEARNLDKILQKNVECNFKTHRSTSEIASAIINLMMHPEPVARPSACQLLEVDWFGQKGKIINCSSVITSVSSVNPQIVI
ncbi:hypothetical protein SteCoe_23304 [Stentor coeruleus]|uniref:Protein kinase domain-containing protein n=1 Tax=Stentor coeruleus TaxID=5963 RepID=A0A1R2BK61_9CILI|nr:hypothetical protein SteCoe_23304 [Stentor coeruleus]